MFGLPEQVGTGVGVGQRSFRGQQGEQMGFLRAAGVELHLKLPFLVILEGNAVSGFAHANGAQLHLKIQGAHGQLRHQGVFAVIDHGSDHNDFLLSLCICFCVKKSPVVLKNQSKTTGADMKKETGFYLKSSLYFPEKSGSVWVRLPLLREKGGVASTEKPCTFLAH